MSFFTALQKLTRDAWKFEEQKQKEYTENLKEFYRTLNQEPFKGFLIQIQNKMKDAALNGDTKIVINLFDFFNKNEMYNHFTKFDSLFQEELPESHDLNTDKVEYFIVYSYFYLIKWIEMLVGIEQDYRQNIFGEEHDKYEYLKNPPLIGFPYEVTNCDNSITGKVITFDWSFGILDSAPSDNEEE